jgi:hypothetical protein
VKQTQEFAVYKGETFITLGTAKECAAQLGIKPSSFKWYTTPTGKRRIENRKNRDKCLYIDRLEDDGDE